MTKLPLTKSLPLLFVAGALVAAEHARVKEALLPHLEEPRQQLRKRALHCLGGWMGGFVCGWAGEREGGGGGGGGGMGGRVGG